MTAAVNRASDNTVELTITIPWSDIAASYEKVVAETIKNTELPGFRKGKAPKKLAEGALDKAKVYEEVIKRVVPKAYSEAVSQHGLRPILLPQIDLKEASEGKDWVVLARTCEKPAVTLGDYKKVIGELKAAKTKKIYLPGQSDKTEADKDQKPTLEEILTATLGTVTINLPTVLVEHEVNHLLSQLIDQTRKLGLTVEKYLASTGRTTESLKAEYDKEARRTLTLEFALEAIADKEGITVTDTDIDTILKTAKSEEERQALERERYYLASLVRRQKTLDFLAGL